MPRLEVLNGPSKLPDQCGEEKNTVKPENGKNIKTRVVFHLDADEEKRLVMALNNMANLLKEVPPEEASVCLVANGSAVKLFQREHGAAKNARVEALAGKGVHFLMCNNSLSNFNIDPDQLITGCTVTKAGVLELIERQADGYAYIKP